MRSSPGSACRWQVLLTPAITGLPLVTLIHFRAGRQLRCMALLCVRETLSHTEVGKESGSIVASTTGGGIRCMASDCGMFASAIAAKWPT